MGKQFSPFSKESLMPKPERLEVFKQKGALKIGIPKEILLEEKRICLTPDAVSTLVNNGHEVLVETGAGIGANYTDKNYSEAGAKIAYDNKSVLGCQIILKVEPPTPDEIALINPQSVLFSAMQLKTQDKTYFEMLASKGITAIAFDYIKDEHGIYPIVKSLSEIAGIASVHVAAELLNNCNHGNGILLGNIAGVNPSKLIILGAGNVGEAAARVAIGLGLNITVFDNSISKLRNLQYNLGKMIATSTIQPKVLQKQLMRCDAVIGALYGKPRTPIVVTETMVKRMKNGAIIVDVSIDRGGCFETSEVTKHSQPTFIKHGVIHYCVPNIPSRYSRTASISISNFFTPYLLKIGERGGLENALRFDKGLQNGVYFFHGILTNKTVADWFNLPFRDINLLIS